jgi:hypothetical protein
MTDIITAVAVGVLTILGILYPQTAMVAVLGVMGIATMTLIRIEIHLRDR